MGFIKKAVKSTADKVDEDIGEEIGNSIGNVAKGALHATSFLLNKTSDVINKTVEFGGNAATKLVEANNRARLKKEVGRKDYYLFVTKQSDADEIYSVTDKKKVEKYTTLLDKKGSNHLRINVYNGSKGKIATIDESFTTTRRMFSKEVRNYSYSFVYEGITKSADLVWRDGNAYFTTDFNNWITTGDVSNSNYKIIDKNDGRVVANILKKNSSASTFMIECEYDKNEPIIVIMAIMIDSAMN